MNEQENKHSTLRPGYLLNRQNWHQLLQQSKDNPALMMRGALQYLRQETNGELDLVDASNPATLLMEFGATLAANNFRYFLGADKKHYPVLATSLQDLYHHMSDELYQSRFATPSVGKFIFTVKRSDILKRAVETGVDGVRKLLIPRGSVFQADGVNFTVLNAIEIRVSAYDAIQAIYSRDYRDSYDPIRSNILEYYFAWNNQLEEECLLIEIPLKQVEVTREESTLTHLGNIHNELVKYKDKFIQARVYLHKIDDTIEEIKTTHSAYVYNPGEVTARIAVMEGNMLHVNIPALYYNTDKVPEANVIVEAYTTLGDVTIPLKSVSEQIGIAVSLNDDGSLLAKDSRYTAPWSEIDYQVYCQEDSFGGADGVTFDKLKQWVIDGGTSKTAPITPANIRMSADLKGYDLVTDIDNITGRVFQATRELTHGVKDEFARGVGCAIEPVVIRMEEIENHPSVNNHRNRMTILPSALFRTVNGQTSLLFPDEIPTPKQFKNMDKYLDKVNGLEYVFTPFYYCLDVSDGFDMRAYHMDAPRFEALTFEDNNAETNILVSSDRVEIKRHERGYVVRVVTRSSDSYKQLDPSKMFAQLAFKPEGQYELAYINGKLIGADDDDNTIWEFILETTFDFTKDHHLLFNNFKILSTEYRELPCQLYTWFHVFFGYYGEPEDTKRPHALDERLGRHILDITRPIYALTENKVRFRFGWSLDRLWRNSRTMESVVGYERHEVSVPLTYTENVYRVGEDGLPVHTDDGHGGYNFEIEHRIGDPVLDEQGNPMFKFRKGDVKLDNKGRPIVAKPKVVQRVLDIFFLDGIYRFSNAPEDIEYIQSIPEVVVGWLETDIRQLQNNLLEKTELYFSPKRTMGYIDVLAEDSMKRTIFNRLPFKVRYYLSHRSFSDNDFKEALTAMTHKTINELLRNRTISRDIIEQSLRQRGGAEHIFGVNVVDMGLGTDINTMTVLGAGNQCSVRRIIAQQANGVLKVKEDIQIEFINHDKAIYQGTKQHDTI